MLRNRLSTFKFLNCQKARLCVLLQAGDIILAENIKLIDMIKEINCRKNKLLTGAIEPTLKSLRVRWKTEARPIPRTQFVPLAKRFSGLSK